MSFSGLILLIHVFRFVKYFLCFLMINFHYIFICGVIIWIAENLRVVNDIPLVISQTISTLISGLLARHRCELIGISCISSLSYWCFKSTITIMTHLRRPPIHSWCCLKLVVSKGCIARLFLRNRKR